MVILDKDYYIKSVEALSKDFSKFTKSHVAPNKDLNYIIKSEKRVFRKIFKSSEKA